MVLNLKIWLGEVEKDMIFSDIKIEISANTVAWYGAIVSSLAFFIAFLTYKRDRAKIVVEWQKDMFFYDDSINPGEPYLLIKVINKGRRSVRIQQVGFSNLYKRGGGILNPYYISLPSTVSEGESLSLTWKQKNIFNKPISSFNVYDATGKVYKARVVSLPEYLFDKIVKFFLKLKNHKKKS